MSLPVLLLVGLTVAVFVVTISRRERSVRPPARSDVSAPMEGLLYNSLASHTARDRQAAEDDEPVNR